MGYNNSSRRRTSVFIIILIFAVLISMRAVHLVAVEASLVMKGGKLITPEIRFSLGTGSMMIICLCMSVQ